MNFFRGTNDPDSTKFLDCFRDEFFSPDVQLDSVCEHKGRVIIEIANGIVHVCELITLARALGVEIDDLAVQINRIDIESVVVTCHTLCPVEEDVLTNLVRKIQSHIAQVNV